MNRIKNIFQQDSKKLSIYFTAGYPNLEDTIPTLKALEKEGVDLVELGMPYSDPLADGPTIQASGAKALENGMSLDVLFEQLEGFRAEVNIPVVLMGYYNQVLQYGIEAFVKKAAELGADGVILPDLPLHEYENDYKALFEKYDICISFLITPQTPEARIREIDRLSSGFVYVVSTAATTGKQEGFSDAQQAYFNRLKAMKLENPMMIGFGIHDAATFDAACAVADGAIIGSAFIRALAEEGTVEDKVGEFVKQLRGVVDHVS
jgi:tryptophan synthase alpha chain